MYYSIWHSFSWHRYIAQPLLATEQWQSIYANYTRIDAGNAKGSLIDAKSSKGKIILHLLFGLSPKFARRTFSREKSACAICLQRYIYVYIYTCVKEEPTLCVCVRACLVLCFPSRVSSCTDLTEAPPASHWVPVWTFSSHEQGCQVLVIEKCQTLF